MQPLTLSRNELKAISSDKRMDILKLLKERNHTLSELSERLDIKMPSTKEHLQKLSGAGLIGVADSGHKWKYYALTKKGRMLFAQETSFLLLFSASIIVFAGALFLLAGSNLLSMQFPGSQAALKATTFETTAVAESMAPGAAMPSQVAEATAPAGTSTVQASDFMPFLLAALIVASGIASIYFYKRLKHF